MMPPWSRQAHARLLGLLAATIVVLTMLWAPSSALAVNVDEFERAEVSRINRYRVSHGLARVKIDTRLTRVAEWMGGDMVGYDYFSHTDHLGRDPFQRLAAFGYPSNSWRGENLAAGYEDAARTFEQWRTSTPHRRNMLNSHYRAIGIARVCNQATTYGCYWVTEFGSVVVNPV